MKWLKNRVGKGCTFNAIILYFLVKILLVKLKNLHISSMLEDKLWHSKTETENVKVTNGGIYQNL